MTEQLIKERDEALAKLSALRAELNEQARLNGMGAQRELAFMAKLDIAIDALEDYRDMPGWSCTKSTTKYSTATIALDKLKITGSSEGTSTNDPT